LIFCLKKVIGNIKIDDIRGTENANDFLLKFIHGALLLADLFNDLSKNKVSYSKTKHSLLITEWIVENSPSDLEELKLLLINTLQPQIN